MLAERKVSEDGAFSTIKLAVIMTVHNRCDKTLRCLADVHVASERVGVVPHVYLTDDGCTDNTVSEVLGRFPNVKILHGDGDLYWAGGMRVAWAEAMKGEYDYFLWLNDDTFLYPTAIQDLFFVSDHLAARCESLPIVVGSVCGTEEKSITHGGIRKWTRLNSRLISPDGSIQFCETMYGNCVLIPLHVSQRLGNLDPIFQHSIGDVDYGLRATSAGIDIAVAPNFVGECDLNPVTGSLNDARLPLISRYKMLLSVKGLPPVPFFKFLWRHKRSYGIAYGVWVYSKVLFSWLLRRP